MPPQEPTSADDIAPGIYIPAAALRFQFSRSSGPGGQNVNKVNTKVQLWVPLVEIQGLSAPALNRLRVLAGGRLTSEDEIFLSSDASRSQSANQRQVMQMLRELILQAKREPKKRRKSRPSRAAKQRRLDQKHHRAEIKKNRGDPKDRAS